MAKRSSNRSGEKKNETISSSIDFFSIYLIFISRGKEGVEGGGSSGSVMACVSNAWFRRGIPWASVDSWTQAGRRWRSQDLVWFFCETLRGAC